MKKKQKVILSTKEKEFKSKKNAKYSGQVEKKIVSSVKLTWWWWWWTIELCEQLFIITCKFTLSKKKNVSKWAAQKICFHTTKKSLK